MATISLPVNQSDTFEIQRQKINSLAAQTTAGLKAWVQFGVGANPYPITILSQYNVSSVVRNSQGLYTITFTTALPSTNYIVIGNGLQYNPSGGNVTLSEYWSGSGTGYGSASVIRGLKTTTQVQVMTLDTDVSGQPFNDSIASALIFGY